MKKEMSANKQLAINMSASFVAYGVSLVISFFLSPYIVKTIGVEANGFITLANNFVSYATVVTLALNSLAGRFITISIVKKDIDSANKYFSSVYYANLIISLFLFVIGSFIVVFLEKIIHIPTHLILDVKILFSCLFLNCILSVVGSVFSVAPFTRNKLYLESLRNIESNIARLLIIVGLFALFVPRVWYIGLGTLVSGIYVLICNLYYTKKLLPEIHIKRIYYNGKAVWELISSGIWNTINRLGQILTDGLDLLITNLLIDSVAMGVLALAKTVPSMISGLMGSIVGVFSPNYTILYAEEKYDALLRQIKQSMKIMGVIVNWPIIILVVCGQDFFRLWQPTQNAGELQILSILTIACLTISGGINCLYGVFTVVNKIKVNSLVVVFSGLLSTLLTLLALNTTNWGVYAVAGVSSAVSIIRNLVFTAPYGAKCLNQKWYIFYPDIVRPALYFAASVAICIPIVNLIPSAGWLFLIIKGLISSLVSALIGVFVVLKKEERKAVFSKLKRR